MPPLPHGRPSDSSPSSDTMSTFALGQIQVRRSGYGAMQLAGPFAFGPPPDRATAIAVLRAAVAAVRRTEPRPARSTVPPVILSSPGWPIVEPSGNATATALGRPRRWGTLGPSVWRGGGLATDLHANSRSDDAPIESITQSMKISVLLQYIKRDFTLCRRTEILAPRRVRMRCCRDFGSSRWRSTSTTGSPKAGL